MLLYIVATLFDPVKVAELREIASFPASLLRLIVVAVVGPGEMFSNTRPRDIFTLLEFNTSAARFVVSVPICICWLESAV